MAFHTAFRLRPASLLFAATLAAVLVAAACGGGSSNPVSPPPPPPPPPPANVVEVEVRDSLFEPKSITIRPGDTVRWIFRGSVSGHTVRAEDGSFDSGFAFTADGATYERTFGAELDGQTFEYRCISHFVCCQMQGSVRVGDSAPPPDPGY
jgi:plastocyanin